LNPSPTSSRHELAADPAPVHIWLWRTDYDETQCAEVAHMLTPAERTASARFRFPRDRARALTSRAGLRLLLGGYLGLAPETIVFSTTAAGKPRLADSVAITFNLSHSGACAAAVISRGREVGIDLEQIRSGPDWHAIAARFFTEEEQAWLAATPGAAAFFRLWTAKEAVVKAAGTGLALALEHITVKPGEDSPPWNVRELDLAPGYAAAVAFDGPPAAPKILSLQFGCQ
jgi:4'-phosphopantetheinyl transferase